MPCYMALKTKKIRLPKVNNNNNLIIKNEKPFEIVQEVNNEMQSVVGDQIPSYEEFMKNYEKGGVNYDDLSGSEVGESKGYDPCSGCGNSSLKFELEIILKSSSHG